MRIATPIEEYIMEHISPEGDYLYRLFRATNVETVNPQMASGHIQGRLLKMLVEMIRPKNILEIGTFTGYSAICLATHLPEDGHLDTLELNDELEDLIMEGFERAGVDGRVSLLIGVRARDCKRQATLVESFSKGFSDTGSIPVASTKRVLDEHLLL